MENIGEAKTPEQELMERVAEEREREIVRFKNIDSEDFTHSFRGVSITVMAGRELVSRRPEAEHLATHLARKILGREVKRAQEKLPVSQRSAHLWEPAQVEAKMAEMITSFEEKRDEVPSEITKGDVVKELETLGIKFDESLSKEELLKKLVAIKVAIKAKKA